MVLKYIALMHKASLFNRILYDDVLRMYENTALCFTTLSRTEKIRF